MLARIRTNAIAAATIEAEIHAAASYAQERTAPATRRAYAADWRAFEAWAHERGLASLPALPGSIATYLAWEADRGASASTIGRRVAAIRFFHRAAGNASPTTDEAVRATVAGIRRTIGVAPARKAAATAGTLHAMVALCPQTMIGLRNRALLLLGFAMAARRSELVALDVADIADDRGGLVVTIRRSKTDQEGAGQTIAVPFGALNCPVAAVRAWMAAAGISDGPLFRRVARGGRVLAERLHDRVVAEVVKAHAEALGLDPAHFAGHSLRAGFVTSAAERGASIFKIQEVSRHRSVDVLQGYVRRTNLFSDHAGSGLL
jgi:site-specific recombinase XerD